MCGAGCERFLAAYQSYPLLQLVSSLSPSTICPCAGMSRVKPELPAYRQQVAEDLQAIISQLPPAVLDEHVAGIGPFSRGLWKPPCTLATSRLLKLTSRLLRYKVFFVHIKILQSIAYQKYVYKNT